MSELITPEPHRGDTEEDALIEQARRKVQVIRSMTRPNTYKYAPVIANAAMAGAFILVFVNFWIIKGAIQSSRESNESPVKVTKRLTPLLKTVSRGKPMRFDAVYNCEEVNVSVLITDSYENVETTEVYAGETVVRQFDKLGANPVKVVRVIPADLTPGSYRLIGWVTAQTSIRSLPTVYRSDVFEVK